MSAVTYLSSDGGGNYRSAFWTKYFFVIFNICNVYVCFVGNVAVSV